MKDILVIVFLTAALTILARIIVAILPSDDAIAGAFTFYMLYRSTRASYKALTQAKP